MGTQDGKLVALSATNGEQLWEFSLGAPVTAPPITYSAGGRQNIAVVTGGGKMTTDFLIGKDPKLNTGRTSLLAGPSTFLGYLTDAPRLPDADGFDPLCRASAGAVGGLKRCTRRAMCAFVPIPRICRLRVTMPPRPASNSSWRVSSRVNWC